jgi:hypothetical protein
MLWLTDSNASADAAASIFRALFETEYSGSTVFRNYLHLSKKQNDVTFRKTTDLTLT